MSTQISLLTQPMRLVRPIPIRLESGILVYTVSGLPNFTVFAVEPEHDPIWLVMAVSSSQVDYLLIGAGATESTARWVAVPFTSAGDTALDSVQERAGYVDINNWVMSTARSRIIEFGFPPIPREPNERYYLNLMSSGTSSGSIAILNLYCVDRSS